MGRWGCGEILFILLSYLSMTRGQNLGDVCRRQDGTRGTCQQLRDCFDRSGTIEGATRLELCSSSTFNNIIVCCRATPTFIAQLKCLEWKRMANSEGGTCTVNIPLARGGTEATVGEFPHIVSLLQESLTGRLVHICGGMLVSTRYVLTAAHCLNEQDLYVRIGGHDHRVPEAGMTFDSEVARKIPHPNYRHPSRYNDIALIRLLNEVPLSRRVRPACLPFEDRRVEGGKKMVVAGWGSYENGGPTSNVLRKAEVTALDRFRCDRNPGIIGEELRYPVGITDSIICANETIAGACKGDSGGPLMEVTSSTCEVKEVIGVVSRGPPECRSTNIPGTYTRIEYYLDWIVKTVWADELQGIGLNG